MWNLEDVLRPGQAGGPRGQSVYEAKFDALAGVITAIGPEVLAMQKSAT